MQLQELRSQLRQHAQTAFALLQNEATPDFWKDDEPEGKHILWHVERDDWSQVFIGIERASSENQFSAELLDHLLQARHAKNSHDFIVAQEMMKRTPDADKQVIGECLRALAHGPFLKEDSELHIITGFQREELAQIAEAWPDIKTQHQGWVPNFEFPDFVSLTVCAVSSTLGTFWGYYLDVSERNWAKHISLSRAQIEQVFENWRNLEKEIIEAV